MDAELSPSPEALRRAAQHAEHLAGQLHSGGLTMCDNHRMADDQHGGPLAGLVDVVFVGGPYHARRMLMASPEFRMELEQSSGERIAYCRHMLEAELRDGRYMNIATYAPVGVSDEEFARLVMDAARLR